MEGKNVILGITGGIAAYKAAIIVRLLVKLGARVQVVMTASAKEFVSPLTLATLSKRPILVDFFNPENGTWNSHVDLGIWADVMIIAPATANTIGKAACGIADNLLLTTFLSAKCPVFWVPTMDLDMYRHPAVQQNLEKLKSFGNHIIEAEIGELASGLVGKGRMAEPETIVENLKQFFDVPKILNRKKILITAGPTYENIDPVRFIGNSSSGKMAYALADALSEIGADVTMISGPVKIKPENSEIKIIRIKTADEMLEKTKEHFEESEIIVFAAAVADYKPKIYSESKIKKSDDNLILELTKNPDIAEELGKLKTEKQISVGFALETEHELENALTKLQRKNFDIIVLNSLSDSGAGFEHDTNKITIVDKYNNIQKFELKSKKEVAKDIVQKIISFGKYNN
jgi:phosphopantothenoylcysteine decarboxylase/phosphopantothenate--cysteine ligase